MQCFCNSFQKCSSRFAVFSIFCGYIDVETLKLCQLKISSKLRMIPIFISTLFQCWSDSINLCLYLFFLLFSLSKSPGFQTEKNLLVYFITNGSTIWHIWVLFFFWWGGVGRGRQTLEGVRYSSCIDGLDSYCAGFLVFDKAHKAVVGESISLVSMVTRKILWNSKGWNKPE